MTDPNYSDSTDITLGELYRNIERVGRDVTDIKTDLKQMPDWRDLERIESNLKESDKKLDVRLEAIETKLSNWWIRIATVAGPIIAFIAIIITIATLIKWGDTP